MRHVIRYLPAFLALLIPLGVLAFLGSRELSRQQERAENFLRERAFDFLATAALSFDDEIDKYFDNVLLQSLNTDYPTLFAASRGIRTAHPELPELVDLVVFDASGYRVQPHRGGPRRSRTWARMGSQVAQALQNAGDDQAAINRLSRIIADNATGDAASRGRAEVQLAGIYRARGNYLLARELLERALAELPEIIVPPRPRGRGRAAQEYFTKTIDHSIVTTTELLCRTSLAELQLEASGDAPDTRGLVEVAERIRDGHYQEVSAELLTATFERIAALIPEGAPEHDVVVATRHGLMEQLDGQQRAREIDLYVVDRLRNRAQLAEPEDRIYRVFDTLISTHLLILRRTRPEESSLYGTGTVGLQIDLTALASRVLAPAMDSREDGFHLDLLSPDGTAVLHHERPEGAEDWEQLSRAAVAGLQFLAIPRNARQQIESRRATARNYALLWLALCLVAGGGAFFLLRSVGREAELAAMKVDLVSRVSHELRTPLAMIKMYGDTLEMGRTKDQTQAAQFAHVISREADRLTMLIDRILDFSRRQSGEISYHKETLDPAAIVEDICDEYRPHVEGSNIELTTDLHHGLSVSVDKETFESTIVNLIENAAKYTPESTVERTIELSLQRRDDMAVLEVRDRGIGIPSGEDKKIFESFYRATNAGEARGTGLGLSLVQHFAEAHGGEVEAQARPGGGTVLRLALPLLTTRPNDGARDNES